TLHVLTFESARRHPAVTGFGHDRYALAAVSVAGVNVITAIHAATIHRHFPAVGECVFDRIGIEILVDVGFAVGIVAIVASTQRLRFNGPRVLHPAEVVDMMNVKVAEASTAGPKETVEVPNLPK